VGRLNKIDCDSCRQKEGVSKSDRKAGRSRSVKARRATCSIV
jgi:hypothetical protein